MRDQEETGSSGRAGSEKMPRVVPDQRSKFENEEFFRKLSRECEVSETAEIKRRKAVKAAGRAPLHLICLYFISAHAD